MDAKQGNALKVEDPSTIAANKARDAELLAEQARKEVTELSNDEIT